MNRCPHPLRTGRRALALALVLGFGACAGDAPPESDAAAPDTRVVQPSGEEADVLATVQGFTDALGAHDSEALARVLLAEGSVHALSVRPDRPSGALRSRPGSADIASMDNPGPPLLERLRDPEVRVAGRVAMVWAPYDFWQDGRWSHCGTDAFTLLKGEGGWVITSISYTVETDGCVPGPRDP